MKKTTKAGLAIAAVAAVATSAMVISAWGPDNRKTYTMENPADKVTFNSITNNPTLIGSTNVEDCKNAGAACDERYFVSASEFTGDASKNSWGDTTTVEDGKEYVVRMYVHNDAASNLNLVAENVKAYVNLPTDAGTSVTVQGILTSSNADPGKVWDETTFVSGNGEVFNLAYVEGTAKYTNCDESTRADDRACTSTRKFDLDSNLFTSNGSTLGYSQMDGKIPGCIGYSGWVTFHVKAQFAAKPSYDIEKTVKIKGKGDFAPEVEAKSGDELVYNLHFTNTGNVNVYNVVLRDTLPEGVTFVRDSAYLITPENPEGLLLDNNVLFSQTGVNIGSYAPNSDANIVFNVKVNDDLSEKCSNTDLKNTVEAIAKNENGADLEVKLDEAHAYVDGRLCNESFDIDKMVRLENDKEWSETVKAKAGEKVYYRIRFFNTGNTDLENVVVKDKLPEHMTNISAVNYGVIVEGKDSKLTTGEGFFDGGMNIGTVKAGETVGIYFNATVDGALADECGDIAPLENIVTGKYNNDDSTTKTDNAIVTVDGQVCTEDTPGFEINKMVQVEGGDDWKENVTVKANDTVRYRIQFKNTGNTTLENVVIRDTLPAGMNFAGNTKLYNAEFTEGKNIEGDDIVKGGLNIGSVAAGSEATIFFNATVDNSFADDCDDHTLTNTVAGKYNNDDNTEKTDTADVTVDGIVCDEPDVPEYPTTGAESTLGAIVAIASLSAATAGYIISRKK